MRSLVIICLVICQFVCYGQSDINPHERAFTILEQVDATPVQREKLKDLRIKYKDLFQHLSNADLEKQVRQRKRQALLHDFKTELRTILTPSQIRSLRDKLQRNADSRKDHFKSNFRDLNLSVEQQENIQNILKSQREDVENVRNSDWSREEKATEIGEIRSETLAEIRKILTPEQFVELEKKLAQKRQGRPQKGRRPGL